MLVKRELHDFRVLRPKPERVEKQSLGPSDWVLRGEEVVLHLVSGYNRAQFSRDSQGQPPAPRVIQTD